jgi:Leucine-rich repeat (LRR) protein
MSQLAQQVIAECKRTKNPTLDLYNCSPVKSTDLIRMEWVETLILGYDAWKFELQDEKKFNISDWHQNFNDFPSLHKYFPFLRKLVAQNIGIRDEHILKNLTSLNTLDLRDCLILNWHFLEDLAELKTLYLGSPCKLASKPNTN